MNATQMNYQLKLNILNRTGIEVSIDQARTLRRAELTLRRWYEMECGDSNNYCSWHIQREETTNKPYRITTFHRSPAYPDRKEAIADREAGAIKRVEAIGKEHSMFYYLQTDPRGASLYVSNEKLTPSNYSSVGVCCCVG